MARSGRVEEMSFLAPRKAAGSNPSISSLMSVGKKLGKTSSRATIGASKPSPWMNLLPAPNPDKNLTPTNTVTRTVTPTPSKSLCDTIYLGQILYNPVIYNNEPVKVLYKGAALAGILNDKIVNVINDISVSPTPTPTITRSATPTVTPTT